MRRADDDEGTVMQEGESFIESEHTSFHNVDEENKIEFD